MSYNANGLAQTNGSVVFYGNTRSASSGGGGGLSQLVIVTAEDFAEETITLTNSDDSTTLTETADSNGVAKFTVSSAGTWTATADDSGTTVTLGSVTLNVSEINYTNSGVSFAVHYSENDNDSDSVDYPLGYDNSNWGNDTAYMDFQNGTWHWGAWNPNGVHASKVKWIIPKSCMLKSDGTVDYYLNEDNEGLKADGTVSDIANTSYDGNAMMEWAQDGKKIWWKIVPDSDGNGFTFCVADHQKDSYYVNWNHHDCNSLAKPHFYTPKYGGSIVGSKMRSLSGLTNLSGKTRPEEISLATANNSGQEVHWYTETWVDRLLIDMLTLLITKSTNSQAKIGKGRLVDDSPINTGTMATKGMFYGENTTTSGVKVWGMENVWGNLHRSIAGLMMINGKLMAKLTYGTEDGSTVTGYNTTASGYKEVATATNNSGGFISHMYACADGVYPMLSDGSSSTYYCDGYYYSNGGYACVGGSTHDGDGIGIWQIFIEKSVSFTHSRWSAALSYK